MLEYERRGALIAEFEEAVADLVPEASSGRYEEALANLGAYLGFEAERPDKAHGVGPDVLWRTDGSFDFVIEAKSRKDEDNPLYKKEHAQLLEAEHWFKLAYPGLKNLMSQNSSTNQRAMTRALEDLFTRCFRRYAA
jgi:replicative superfamily II helicase